MGCGELGATSERALVDLDHGAGRSTAPAPLIDACVVVLGAAAVSGGKRPGFRRAGLGRCFKGRERVCVLARNFIALFKRETEHLCLRPLML